MNSVTLRRFLACLVLPMLPNLRCVHALSAALLKSQVCGFSSIKHIHKGGIILCYFEESRQEWKIKLAITLPSLLRHCELTESAL